MEAKVVRWGDGFAVRLSADEASALGVGEGGTVEVRPKASPGGSAGSGAVDVPAGPGLRSVNGLPPYTLADMIAEMERLGPQNRPETVDWGPDVGSEIIDDDDPS